MATETIIHPPRTMMEVFESLPEGTLVQLIENNIVMSPSPVDKHSYLVIELGSELRNFNKANKKGAVRLAPTDVYLDKKNAYQPDIFFVSNERMHIKKGNNWHGAPDLVIEVLSPSTAKYDLQEKKDVYERNGVKEYWIVDPADDSAIGYYLVNDEYHQFFKGVGRIESKLLDWQVDF
jgi:Uma2 family endonuclease